MSDHLVWAALRGHPSYVWRFGQERRLALMNTYAPLRGRRILDIGCGIGTYAEHLRQFSEQVYGIDIEPERIAEGSKRLPNLLVAAAERPPFLSESFDVILLHEVLEHVEDDHLVVTNAHRLLVPGGRMVIFVPNRLYPFETHGVYWRGKYRFGNFPLVNYLPNSLRERLCPHVRTYTWKDLRALLTGLDYQLIVQTQMYPGYDNVIARRPALGSILRRITYRLEGTPLRAFGLSHLLVIEKPNAP